MTPEAPPRPRRRWARLGAGLALAIAADLVAWLPPAGGLEPAQAERRTAEEEMELLRLARRFPPEPDAEAERQVLRQLAEHSGLRDIEVATLPGAEGDLSRELEALGATAQIHELSASGQGMDAVATLPRLRFLARPSLLESVEIRPTSPGEVRLVARIAFPVLEPWSVGLERTRAVVDRIESPPDPISTLLRLSKRAHELPVGLTRFRFGPALEIEAVAVGRRAAAAFETALRESGFEEARVAVEPRGGCLVIAATGGVGRGSEQELEAALGALASVAFFAESESLCAADEPVPTIRVEARGTAAGTDGLTLRMRGASRYDAMATLEQATGRPMVGFGEATSRLDLELEAVTTEEALTAIAAAGVELQRFGEAILWSRSVTERAPDLPYDGEPVSMSFRCADLRDLLSLFGDLTGLTFEPADEVGGCVEAAATERPWDEVFEAILFAAGLDYRIEGTTVGIKRASAAAGTKPNPDPRWRLPIEQVSLGELRMNALLASPSGWRAFATGPMGWRYELSPGLELGDATVQSVDGNGVALTVAGGRALRLDLP